MARDYVEILKRVEAHYPQALGSTSSQDSVLKANITNFANDLIAEIDREQRWSLSFNEPNFTTVPGTATYALPFPSGGAAPLLTQTFIDRIYYENPTTGRITRLQRLNKEELQRVFGDAVGTTVNVGAPKYYSIDAQAAYSAGVPTLVVTLYPAPDGAGPSSGNYVIRMAGYFNTPAIIETQGSTTAASPTLTLAANATTFLTDNGVPAISTGLGLGLSVRTAGNPGIGGTNDTLITGWSAFPTNATVIMTSPAVVNTTNVQAFFNSTNWIITHWPKVLIFGILREVASYYGSTDKYAVWEQRFQDQMKRLRDYEFDRARSIDSHVVAYSGGDSSALRVPDSGLGWDVRGGTAF